MQSKNIAIFGANGHIGKNLSILFSNDREFKITCFVRDSTKIKNNYSFVDNLVSIKDYESFESGSFDGIINCIGISNPRDISKKYNLIFEVTEQYDKKIINYLQRNNSTIFINISSGAVYGNKFNHPISDTSRSTIDLNHFEKEFSYSISKINSELKHRAFSELNIIDLRLFSFFSRHIDLNSGFFITELINSIKNKSKFITSKIDFVRDYVNPQDFFSLIKNCLNSKDLNDVFDVYSRESITKLEILEKMSEEYDIKIRFKDDFPKSPTGFKKEYYSISKKAERISYHPKFSSMETILSESKLLLEEM